MRSFSLGVLIGILLVIGLPTLPTLSSMWLVIAGLTSVVTSLAVTQKWYLRLAGGIVLGFCLIIITSNGILNNRLPESLHGTDIIVYGNVDSIPIRKTNGWSFNFTINEAHTADRPENKLPLTGRIRLGWYQYKHSTYSKKQQNNSLASEISTPKAPHLFKPITVNEKWQLTVRLKPPSGFMNPGGFDYESWLFSNRIIATGYVRNQSKNNLIQPAPPYFSDNIRASLYEKIQNAIGENRQSSIISALAVAIRHDITPEQWDIFRETGTSHLMAISGLHIGIVASLGLLPIWLLSFLYPNLFLRVNKAVLVGAIGAILAITYTMLAGFTLPTQRALIMVLVIIVGLVIRRSIDSFSILAIALLIVLILDPLAVLSPGFWLSFFAVGIIFYLLKRRINKSKWDIFTIQIALSVGIFPITLFFFGEASISSPIANLIAIPWVSLIIVPTILIALPCLFLAPIIATPLLNFAAWNIEQLFSLLEWIASSTDTLTLPEMPMIYLTVAFLGFLILFLPKHFPARWLGLLLFIPAFNYSLAPIPKGDFKLHILDVGQGTATVIETTNHILIYDTGPKSSNTFDTGKLVVIPFLKAKGINKVDTVIVSHEDNDHSGGLASIVNAISVDTVLSSDTSLLPDNKVTHCDKGLHWQWDNIYFDILHPEASWHGNDNNRSCVLKISNGSQSLLLTGDIQKKAENYLVKHDSSKLEADVLLLGHHGSNTSSSSTFLNAVKPDIAIISAGYMNRYRFPSKKVMKRLEESNIVSYNTANHGAISVYFNNTDDSITTKFYRDEKRRFWHR